MDPSQLQHKPNRLRQERIQRNWRQREVAEQVGTTVVTVRRWEQGHQQPSAYFRLKLCALFEKSAEELGLIKEDQSAPLITVPAARDLPSRPHALESELPSSVDTEVSEPPSYAEVPDEAILSTSPLRSQSDRGRLLRWLYRDYQRSLDESLEHLAWITLGLTEHPDAVRNAIHLLQRFPDRSERSLPLGTTLLEAYDQAEEALLILGNPGAGKSTLLRDLALQLVMRAQQDETYPIPVILPLSSWAVSKAVFVEWMVEQLARIYDVPRRLSRLWVGQGLILPLLDGLDEMDEMARPLCIAAINTYRKTQVTPLVVCSRRTEYDAASTRQRLTLQNAVIVQPLTRQQVTEVMQQGGAPLVALYAALRKSQNLCDLATTPLMLSVLVLAYRGMVLPDLPQQHALLEQRVWNDYVERMVREKGAERQGKESDAPSKRYALEQTCSWLTWLARQMRAHHQALFYGEQLQEDWLPVGLQRRALTRLALALPAILLGTCISLLLPLFLASSGSVDLATQCQMGLLGGFLGWCVDASQRQPVPGREQRSWWRAFLSTQCQPFLGTGCLAILVAASFGLKLDGQSFFLSDWVHDGLSFGGILLVGAWLLQFVLIRHMPLHPVVSPVSAWASLAIWRRTTLVRRALWTGAILGSCFVVSNGLSNELDYGLSSGLRDGLIAGATIALTTLLLEGQTGRIRLTERVSWSWHALLRLRHLWMSLIVALICLSFFGLINGLSAGLSAGINMGLSVGPDYGFGYGLAIGIQVGLNDGLSVLLSVGPSLGLSVGLSVGLSYWFLLGMYQGITQKHLEDRDRRHFHQGLHRSLRNGLVLSLLGASIIAGMGILSIGLSVGFGAGLGFGFSAGLNAGLSVGLNLGLSEGWFFLVGGWVVLWIATGGQSILRHYTLRLLLAHEYTFPWHAQAFLDDATARVLLQRVGGGYGFVHHQLLEHFANPPLPPS